MVFVMRDFVLMYSDEFKLHNDPRGFHVENARRLDIALSSCFKENVITRSDLYEPRIRSRDLVEEVHDPNYVKYVELLSREGLNFLDQDTYVNKYTFQVALLAVGACIEGIELLLKKKTKRVFALVRPPGHHCGKAGRALSALTQGFCIFNNIAIASYKALRQGVERIVIIDIDVHHGNGTQEIFWNESRILHIDFHQYGIYPGTGDITDLGGKDAEGTKINIALPPYSTDHDYIYAWIEIVEPIIREFKPRLVLVSAGFDAYINEPLALMRLTTRGYEILASKIVNIAKEYSSGKILAVLEGGYEEGLSVALPKFISILKKSRMVKYEIQQLRPRKEVKELVTSLKRILQNYWTF
ncbi:MAG: histone deacetylase family protein [Thermoprotei archaeon]|nr:MAG: histone deacetylase family protein [Thermoprotei archaeon]